MTNKINICNRFYKLFFFTFSLFIGTSFYAKASDSLQNTEHESEIQSSANSDSKEKKIDIASIAFEHILDSHSWHFWGHGHEAVSIPLPVILKAKSGIVFFMSSEFHHDVHGNIVVEKNGERFVNFEEKIYYASDYANEHGQFLEFGKNSKGKEEVLNAAVLDFSITKNVTQLFISAIVLFLLFTSIARAYKKQGITTPPKGKQSFFEPLVVFVRDDIAKGNIGSKSDKFVPYLLTVFFLILINNVFGLIPIGANLTGNIAFTFVLAVFTLVLTNVNGNKNYWSHIFLPHAPKAVWIILIPIEIASIFIKPFALMVRLFANIAAGHIIVISLIGLIFIFKNWGIAPVSVAFALFIDVLECLVAFLQAYIFTMLTALFIGSAVADHNEDGVHDTDDKALEVIKH